ncbi:MAG: hypothetical protein ACK56F_11390 [bacterium]
MARERPQALLDAGRLAPGGHLQSCGKLRHSSGYQHAMQHV